MKKNGKQTATADVQTQTATADVHENWTDEELVQEITQGRKALRKCKVILFKRAINGALSGNFRSMRLLLDAVEKTPDSAKIKRAIGYFSGGIHLEVTRRGAEWVAGDEPAIKFDGKGNPMLSGDAESKTRAREMWDKHLSHIDYDCLVVRKPVEQLDSLKYAMELSSSIAKKLREGKFKYPELMVRILEDIDSDIQVWKETLLGGQGLV